MKEKDTREGIRRFLCICLTVIMLSSTVCVDTYASASSGLPTETDAAGEVEELREDEKIIAGNEPEAEASAMPAEETVSGDAKASAMPAEEIVPEETEALEPEEESDPESAAADEPAADLEQSELEDLVQTQEGLERAIAEGLAVFECPDPGIAVISAAAGSRQDIIRIAKKQVGISGRPNKFTYWYGPISGYSNPYAYAWCQVFASWCGYQAGVSVPRTASCYYGGEWFKERGLWKSRGSGYQPKAGDYIYFDWNANGGWDHVGIVNYVSGGRVYTIEGNTGDMVKDSKSYSLTDTEIIGYGTPKYAGETVQSNLPKGCFDEAVPEKGTYKVHFRGWSFDWDDPSKSVQVHIYVGGKAGSGAPVYAALANTYRPDVDNAYPGCGDYHGFDVTIDVPVDRSKKQTVYVYAVDAGGLDNPLLGSKKLKADKTLAGTDSSDGVPGTSQEIQKPENTAVTVGTAEKPVLKQVAYNQFKITWDSVKGADSYEVQYAPDKDFSDPMMYSVKKTAATVKVACGATRYFRVRACRTVDDTKYYGSYSGTAKDKTVLGKTEVTSCISKKKKRITVSTSNVEGATSYQIAVSLKKNFAGARYAATKSGTKSLSVNRSSTYYYVKTRARRMVSGKYVYGPYSAVKRIKVK